MSIDPPDEPNEDESCPRNFKKYIPRCDACVLHPVATTQHDKKQGAESISQCKCDPGFYDSLEGIGGDDGGAPSCSECPFGGGGWDTAGAINVAACSCPAGWYLDEVAETCVECEAGTYKVRDKQ